MLFNNYDSRFKPLDELIKNECKQMAYVDCPVNQKELNRLLKQLYDIERQQNKRKKY